MPIIPRLEDNTLIFEIYLQSIPCTYALNPESDPHPEPITGAEKALLTYVCHLGRSTQPIEDCKKASGWPQWMHPGL